MKLMAEAALFLTKRGWYRFYEFFAHWYGHGFFNTSHRTLNVLEHFDKTLALRITLRYFFRPLFQDYTYLGRIMGFFFRLTRALIGMVLYTAIIFLSATLFILWSLIPPAVILLIIYE